MNSQDASGMSLPILQGPAKHKDPVCGMTVASEKAAGKVEHGGKTYYFCSKRCSERFSDEPDKFLSASQTGGMEHSPAPAAYGAMPLARSGAYRTAAETTARDSCPTDQQRID